MILEEETCYLDLYGAVNIRHSKTNLIKKKDPLTSASIYLSISLSQSSAVGADEPYWTESRELSLR